MNIKAIFLENKAASSLALTFVLGTAILGYLTWSAWDNYGSATADYSSKASTLDQLSHKEVFPSDSNLKKISETLSDNQANLDKLRKALEAFHVATFGEFDKIKPQDQPQYFQDTLRSEVTAIQPFILDWMTMKTIYHNPSSCHYSPDNLLFLSGLGKASAA